MLIEQNGNIDNKTNMVLFKNNLFIGLDDDQFFQITPTGKRLELWEGKGEYFKEACGGMKRVCYWNMNSVIAFYNVT